MPKTDYETVSQFISQRAQEVIMDEVHAADEEARRPITVRLEPGHVSLIDQLAKELDMSRQSFLDHLIDTALQDSIKTLSDMAPEENRMAVYRAYLDVMTGVKQ
jgi:uncharacterized protein (DUF1778 family)